MNDEQLLQDYRAHLETQPDASHVEYLEGVKAERDNNGTDEDNPYVREGTESQRESWWKGYYSGDCTERSK